MSNERPIHFLEETPDKKARFFSAWKRGVTRLGADLFGPAALDDAREKDDLRPLREVIDPRFSQLNRAEQQLLGAMAGFYNPDWGEELAQRTEDEKCLCGLTFNLDHDEMEIVCTLLRNYTGWERLDMDSTYQA